MQEGITQNDMLDHCMVTVMKHPYDRRGIEHFVFMKLLERCPPGEFEKIVEMYQFDIKAEKE